MARQKDERSWARRGRTVSERSPLVEFIKNESVFGPVPTVRKSVEDQVQGIPVEYFPGVWISKNDDK